MRIISVLLITLVGGHLWDMFIGAPLNWPGSGAIFAVALMGSFIIHEIRESRETDRKDNK